jgi:hypothetical protein
MFCTAAPRDATAAALVIRAGRAHVDAPRRRVAQLASPQVT